MLPIQPPAPQPPLPQPTPEPPAKTPKRKRKPAKLRIEHKEILVVFK